MKYKVLLFLLALSMLPVVSPLEDFGVHKLNDCINLIQTCPNCTYNNITRLITPNKTVVVSDVIMTKSNTVYSYTFCGNNVTGEWTVHGIGDLDGVNEVWAFNYEVTNTGVSLGTSQSIVYSVLFLVLFFLFVVDLFLIAKLPSHNPSNEHNEIIAIGYLKYLKSVLVIFAWGLVLTILLLSSSLASSELKSEGISDFLFSLFKIFSAWQAIVAILLLWMFWIIWNVMRDIRIKGILDRGFFPSEGKYG